jgi:dimethylhistidine N-methyltransferase
MDGSKVRPQVGNPDLLRAARDGLGGAPKQMSPKWFYDDTGSALFERITELPEYYPTRTEISILSRQAKRLATFIPEGAALVELGSGASVKSRLLLDALPRLGAYVPVDISESFLASAGAQIADAYSHLEVVPVPGDFTECLSFPRRIEEMEKVAFFPGSTVGNLEDDEAAQLLARVRSWHGIRGFILGADLVKDEALLLAAYDDAQGVTAAFNMNLLARLNGEADAGFDLDRFAHRAVWNPEFSRIEMHLVSLADQKVRLADAEITFTEGETIHTESSRKYTLDQLSALAHETGWKLVESVSDGNEHFAVVILAPA